MTEEEAKAKVCHRTLGLQPIVDWEQTRKMATPGSYIMASGGQANCIGSACMAWRRLPVPSARNPAIPGWTEGYCGLAGKP